MMCSGCPHKGDLSVACRRPVCPTLIGREFLLSGGRVVGCIKRRQPRKGAGACPDSRPPTAGQTANLSSNHEGGRS